jgi:hypothetical protein
MAVATVLIARAQETGLTADSSSLPTLFHARGRRVHRQRETTQDSVTGRDVARPGTAICKSIAKSKSQSINTDPQSSRPPSPSASKPADDTSPISCNTRCSAIPPRAIARVPAH